MPHAASAARAVAPAWFIAARKEIGTREEPGNRGPAIRRYIAAARCGSEGDPWCAIFANAMLESVGIRGTRSALARSFERDAHFVRLDGPALGCIVTFWRGVKAQGFGHVGFYVGERDGRIFTLGGNESDMVRVEPYPKAAPRFGLSVYVWPKGVPLPALGALPPQLAATGPATGKVT
jgi:uncharacterized protein (TIGR02594 family)